MESVLPSLLAVFALLFGTVTAYRATNDSLDRVTSSWKEMAGMAEDRQRTNFEPVSAVVAADGLSVDLTLDNTGQTMLSVYQRTDVIIQYTDIFAAQNVESLTFVAGSPVAGQWAVTAIQPDFLNPGLVDPGEQMLLTLWVSTEILIGAVNSVVVAAPNGVSTTVQFSR